MPRYCATFVLGLALHSILTLGAVAHFHFQQPAAPVEPVAPIPVAASPSSTAKSDRPGKKPSHANDFLIIGTVFNPQALAYPGANLQIRRMGEKKFRWKTVTNSRGDFAMRVPQGALYEVVVTGKGFAEQKLTVDALHAADNQQRISIRMEPAVGGAK